MVWSLACYQSFLINIGMGTRTRLVLKMHIKSTGWFFFFSFFFPHHSQLCLSTVTGCWSSQMMLNGAFWKQPSLERPCKSRGLFTMQPRTSGTTVAILLRVEILWTLWKCSGPCCLTWSKSSYNCMWFVTYLHVVDHLHITLCAFWNVLVTQSCLATSVQC